MNLSHKDNPGELRDLLNCSECIDQETLLTGMIALSDIVDQIKSDVEKLKRKNESQIGTDNQVKTVERKKVCDSEAEKILEVMQAAGMIQINNSGLGKRIIIKNVDKFSAIMFVQKMKEVKTSNGEYWLNS